MKWTKETLADLGLRLRTGFNPYDYDIYEPTKKEIELQRRIGFFTDPDFNSFGL